MVAAPRAALIPATVYERTDRDDVIRAIKQALKIRSGKPWSVTGGRGTAWGWIKISVPPSRLGCDYGHRWGTDGTTCRDCNSHYLSLSGRREYTCPSHACDEQCYQAYITPADRAELARLLGLESVHLQGVSIPAGQAYRREYLDRAAGRAPRSIGEPYCD